MTPSTEPQNRIWKSAQSAVMISISSAVLFIAFRNSITWHLQRFWGASGDLWQTLWNKVYDDQFNGNEYNLSIWGTFAVTVGLFWLYNIAFIIVDFVEPSWAKPFKIQDNQRLTTGRFFQACARALFNQTVVGLPMIYVTYWLSQWRGCSAGRELPTFPWVVGELAVCIWVEEVMFYYSHRLLHHPRIYKHIHKVHHEWTAPIGIVSVYAHPLEHMVSNVLPIMVGPLICRSHIATSWLWYALALFSTTISHCGYHFPFLPSPEAHDFHHLSFTQNYGVIGVLDHLHNTSDLFRKSKAYDRHFMSLSLVPVKKLYPSADKNKAK